jgi:hypothetical protein
MPAKKHAYANRKNADDKIVMLDKLVKTWPHLGYKHTVTSPHDTLRMP